MTVSSFSPAFSPDFGLSEYASFQLVWPDSLKRGPLVYLGEGKHQLWAHVAHRGNPPGWYDSLIVTPQGEVIVRPNPTFGAVDPDMDDFDRGTVLIGGKDYRFAQEDPVYQALLAAGYQFNLIVETP